ncbi:L-aminoadipate-semialdehyde dehydrogenase [Alteripontixanthobacter maritimus]|uniref:L-aminoadipate-semialdehyde dehydrogenase n=1 Tax=Alteripontixanthobacter maritimus TaxID=2161824 RepID=A0A369Q6I2_9SPHN|nr:SDR family oxidoreductase [Alteripontixanthobacter maritimus]RDC60483.1 L-aminoadipate-semialdehyde dehydrogenase [Alteripontixanthobacter maritimus]
MLLNILLTGAAGLIGGELAERLTQAGHRVTALVRNNRDILANDGTPVEVAEIVTADLTQDRLALDAATYERLANTHDLLMHCAALTRFDASEEEYRATNIEGTARAIALAQAGDMDLLQVSTAYVCGARSGEILETDALPTNSFTNGYEASKAQAEALVRASGLRYAIARPSIVVGDSRTGAIRQFDTIYAAFKLIAEGRVRHMPVARGATLDFVTIDHVAAGITMLAQRMGEANGGAYHLVSGGAVPVETFAAAIGSFPAFDAPMLVEADGFDPDSLPPLERRLFKRVAGLYAAYFQRDPRFDDSRFSAVTGMAGPPVDPALLQRLILYCIDIGFLKDSRAA